MESLEERRGDTEVSTLVDNIGERRESAELGERIDRLVRKVNSFISVGSSFVGWREEGGRIGREVEPRRGLSVVPDPGLAVSWVCCEQPSVLLLCETRCRVEAVLGTLLRC